jgi:hypothetical protein
VTLPIVPTEQFYVTDDDHHTHLLTVGEIDHPLRAGNLAPQDVLNGQVVFEVPVSTVDPVFHLDTGWRNQVPALIDLAIR